MAQPPPAGVSPEQRISAICATGCGLFAVALPIFIVTLWALGSWETLALVRLIPPDILYDMNPAVQPWQRIVGGLICLLPALLLSYGLLRARRSLIAFSRGDFFGAEAVVGLRGYAGATFWAALVGVLSVPLLSVTITLDNAPGHKELSLDLSGGQVLNLLGAAILWVIASAMARAASLARENEQFV